VVFPFHLFKIVLKLFGLLILPIWQEDLFLIFKCLGVFSYLSFADLFVNMCFVAHGINLLKVPLKLEILFLMKETVYICQLDEGHL
jgi:hypothetical protein